MNGPFHTAHPAIAITLPSELEILSPPPLLLPGEDAGHYRLLRGAIFSDVAPRSAIERSLAIDVAELSREIRRCRTQAWKSMCKRAELLSSSRACSMQHKPNVFRFPRKSNITAAQAKASSTIA
ncbi:hypothetical protein [Bradyrhizobium sp. UFLA05-112]